MPTATGSTALCSVNGPGGVPLWMHQANRHSFADAGESRGTEGHASVSMAICGYPLLRRPQAPFRGKLKSQGFMGSPGKVVAGAEGP